MSTPHTYRNIQEDETISCPKCGDAQPDHDGFGFFFCDKCKHCTHDSFSVNENSQSCCDFCGMIELRKSHPELMGETS